MPPSNAHLANGLAASLSGKAEPRGRTRVPGLVESSPRAVEGLWVPALKFRYRVERIAEMTDLLAAGDCLRNE